MLYFVIRAFFDSLGFLMEKGLVRAALRQEKPKGACVVSAYSQERAPGPMGGSQALHPADRIQLLEL